ncbi:MAG: sulfite exporter TauE/SafE family protein [Planctomycetes bacterium]|nr:sulfite exporter TauE/SafE family protein [Planctomycetota bacterium]
MDLRVWLIPLGFVVGAIGTLIGAGGGFVLVPLLLLLYPSHSPELITSISLAVVFFNAFSGTTAYARMKRIDYTSGGLFAVATVPGAVLGALTTAFIPRRLFDAIFGALLLALGAFLLARRERERQEKLPVQPPGHMVRKMVDANGSTFAFAFNPTLGIALSLGVGYLSSVLGVGGGIIHVPALIRLLHFPAHVATATSHFILTFTALGGTIVHIAAGSFTEGGTATLCLAIGALLGAQAGAWVSARVRGVWIVRGLALGLASIGFRILVPVIWR